MEETRGLYLDLIKRSLTNWIYGDQEVSLWSPRKNFFKRKLVDLLNTRSLRIVRSQPMDSHRRETGEDRSPIAHTMIGLKRLENIQFCVEDVLANNIPGDFIETGVWRGGATIFMRAVLKAYGIKDRIVWVADSFEGCPKPNEDEYPHDADDDLYTSKELAISLEKVKANFERYGLLDGQVRFLKGWFKDTLPQAPIEKLAVMRLDGDLYESTIDALTNLYPKLSLGGYVIIDDFGAITACRQAVIDYRNSQAINDEIIKIDWTGVYWKRSQIAPSKKKFKGD